MSVSTPVTFTPVPCSQITPVPVSWLWEPYLPRGKLVVLDGDPGTGKSFVTTDLAARVSAGLPMPDGAAAPPANVLVLSAEDDARDTIRPRLAAAGGDLERVCFFYAPGTGQDRVPRFPDDGPELGDAVRALRPALVVIDPLAAFFGPAVSGGTDQSVRTVLAPLATLAAQTEACIVLVRHLRKSGGANAIYRGAGSIGIVGAVRTGLMIARHPDDPELRVLTVSKTNVGPPGRSLGFRLGCPEGTSQTVVNWTGPLDVSADDLFGSYVPQRAGQRSRERAAEWLRELLADGAKRAAELEVAAREAGIPERTLRRAKRSVGAVSEARAQDGKREWWWRDPRADRSRSAAAQAELNAAAAQLLGRSHRRYAPDERP